MMLTQMVKYKIHSLRNDLRRTEAGQLVGIFTAGSTIPAAIAAIMKMFANHPQYKAHLWFAGAAVLLAVAGDGYLIYKHRRQRKKQKQLNARIANFVITQNHK